MEITDRPNLVILSPPPEKGLDPTLILIKN
jgi:hypothetical protein